MTDGGAPSKVSGVFEERLLRCDVCNHAFLLAYRRGDAAERLSSSRVTSQWVRCPHAECHHLQPVIVPYEGGVVSVTEWLGSSAAIPQRPTYREVLEKTRTPPPQSGAGYPTRRWFGLKAMLRLLSASTAWHQL